MDIAHIAAELAPIAKIGGLADVVFGLSKEQVRKKQNVEIIIPKYDCIEYQLVDDLHVYNPEFFCSFNNEALKCRIWKGSVLGVLVTFIETLNDHPYFERGCIYGCHDDTDRFLAFARCAVEYLNSRNKVPDIIHLHDWHTAVCAPLIKCAFEKSPLSQSRTILTIHNMFYQGHCHKGYMHCIGLNPDCETLADPHHFETVNLLKAGIIHSNYITTVSPKYAEEVKTQEFGFGLDAVIREHASKFSGIINGIDETYWNPLLDPYLPIHYGGEGKEKAKVKAHLRDRLGLKHDNSPIVACISRLVPQKGIELIKESLFHSLNRSAQFILLGSSPIHEIQKEFEELRDSYAGRSDVHIRLKHDEELVHLIFSGADMLVVPSLFEPCGLTQLIALKYGTVPIVRRTGGLADTVHDVDDQNFTEELRNGFSFDNPEDHDLRGTMDRAFGYWDRPSDWTKLVQNAMKMDYSWRRSASDYEKIYQGIL